MTFEVSSTMNLYDNDTTTVALLILKTPHDNDINYENPWQCHVRLNLLITIFKFNDIQ